MSRGNLLSSYNSLIEPMPALILRGFVLRRLVERSISISDTIQEQ
jgi:hypothetical protein